MKKNNRLPLRVYLLYLVIATFVVSGVAFSKYVVSENAEDSSRVASFGNIDLYETKDSDGTTVHTLANTFMLVPGVDITKDPKLYYTAGDVACEIKVIFTLPSYWTQDSSNKNKFSIKNGTKEIVSFTVSASFSFDSANPGVYSFRKVLDPGEALGSVATPVSVIVDDKVTVSASANKADFEYIESLLTTAGHSNVKLDISAVATQID